MLKRMMPHETGLSSLMDALAETSLALPDEALLIEASAQGEDPLAAAEDVRGLLRRTGKHHRQRQLRAAAAEYQRAKVALSTRWVDLPDDPLDRRTLLATVFARNPSMQDAFLTVQHREFKELTDADVESCLAQLLELGVVDLAAGPRNDGKDGEDDGSGEGGA